MSVFSLKVDPFAGCDISKACNEAVRLANNLGITIYFKFNGVLCRACVGDCPDRLEAAWKKELMMPESKHIKIARGGPRA